MGPQPEELGTLGRREAVGIKGAYTDVCTVAEGGSLECKGERPASLA